MNFKMHAIRLVSTYILNADLCNNLNKGMQVKTMSRCAISHLHHKKPIIGSSIESLRLRNKVEHLQLGTQEIL